MLSLAELEQALTWVRDELLDFYPVKLKWLEVYQGRRQLIEADATARAVLRVWQEMLELHNGRWELIDGAVSSACSRVPRAEPRGRGSDSRRSQRWRSTSDVGG